jgi:hypothetical protein
VREEPRAHQERGDADRCGVASTVEPAVRQELGDGTADHAGQQTQEPIEDHRDEPECQHLAERQPEPGPCAQHERLDPASDETDAETEQRPAAERPHST